MAETKPKTAEYRYKLTVSKARKVNTGNYESRDYFASALEGFDDWEQREEVWARLTTLVTEQIDRELLIDSGFRTGDEMPPRPDIAPQVSMPKVSTFTDGKITECENLWPPSLPCRECGKMVDRKDSKYPGNPYYYKCVCGKMNYSKGYKPNKKE